MLASEKLSDKLLISAIASTIALITPVITEGSTEAPAEVKNYQLPQHQNKAERPSLYAYQTLRYGQIGASVKELQQLLHAHGYYHKPIDGKFGPITLLSVRKFQEEHKLDTTGIADSNTISKLLSRQTKQHAYQTLRVGDRGKAVEELQSYLFELGYYAKIIDGIYGRLTYDAVASFQLEHNIQVDGIAGSETFSAILANYKQLGQAEEKHDNQHEIAVDASVISVAKRLIGVPYKWGGASPNGFDCSGYIQYVFEQKGIKLPRTVRELWNIGKSIANPRVGDIVFFQTYRSGPSHAGIYLGENQFIHAGSSKGVTISNLTSNYWKKRYIGAKRLSAYE